MRALLVQMIIFVLSKFSGEASQLVYARVFLFDRQFCVSAGFRKFFENE